MARNVGIVMNVVTGRMGTRQHLVRSVLAIREQGGVVLPGGEVVVPDPILVVRNEKKLRSLAEAHGIERWSTALDASLADPEVEIYFDSRVTTRRTGAVRAAIEAGKHVYCEKPTATSLDEALEIAYLARERGVKNSVVQDKLFLPDTNDYRSQWLGVPQDEDLDNAFKIQWEMYLRHVLADEPFPYDLLEGAKGVQLAELGLRSWSERRWLEVPDLRPARASEKEPGRA
jgi:predicted dehydrogenase